LPDLGRLNNWSLTTDHKLCQWNFQFLKNNCVKHIKSAPYHPSTNGFAERFVQSFKRAMLTNKNLPMEQRLETFLLQYHTTVHAATNAMLLFNRQSRTRLDLL